MATSKPRSCLIALVIGLAAACTPAPDRVDSLVPETDFVLPVNAYDFTAEDKGKIMRARALLIGDCMRRSGKPYDIGKELDAALRAARNELNDFGWHGNKRRYGVTDPGQATSYGYHLGSTVTGTSGQPPRTDDESAVVLKESGCVAKATEILAPGGNIDVANLVTQIGWDSYRESLAAPAVIAASAQWTACMKTKGYDEPKPSESGSAFDVGNRTVSQAEIAAATADVQCKQNSRLVEVWHGFEVSYQRARIDRHEQEMEKIKKDRDELIARATGVIADRS